jgi:hypothetical protein
MNRRQSLQDAARALSLATLFFVSEWIALLDKEHLWFGKFTLFTFNNIFALMLDVLIVAAIIFGAMTFARRSKNEKLLQVARWSFLAAFLTVLWLVFSAQFPAISTNPKATLLKTIGHFNLTEWRVLGLILTSLSAVFMLRRYRYAIAVCVALLVVLVAKTELQIVLLTVVLSFLFFVVRWQGFVIKAAAAFALILFPFFIFTFLQGGYLLSKFLFKPKPATISVRPSPVRVVWIVFDELDYSLAFAKRPASLTLPEFDRLREQAFFSLNAYPPSGNTLMSLPSLLTGKLISRARPANPSEMLLNDEGADKALPFSSQSNIFCEARASGFNTALAGWCIPFQRMIGKNLNSASDQEVGTFNLPKNMLLHLQGPLVDIHLAPIAKSLDKLETKWERQEHEAIYRKVMADGKSAALNADYGLVFLHLPIPHPPGIYHRATGKFDLQGESNYLDSLALADISLGELRRAMEDAGIWDSTILIISSDHWWRPYIWKYTQQWAQGDNDLVETETNVNHRVPFLVKMANQKTNLNYEPAFNTVLTKDLILSILRGDTRSVEEVKNWLEQNRSIGESPYSFEKLQE